MKIDRLGPRVPRIVVGSAIAAACLAPAWGPTPSAAAPRLRIAPSVSHAFGHTAYEINALTEDPRGTGELVSLKSRLEFPIDAPLLGVTVDWRPGTKGSGPWSVTAEVRGNLGDSSKRMTNDDYIAGRHVIHVDSDAESDLLLGSIGLGYRVKGGERVTVSARLHVHYERMTQHVVGYEGWQRSLFSDAQFPLNETRPALDYEVTYVSPRLGGGAEVRLGRVASASLEGAAGVVFASDTDDHLLRRRLAEGDGFGLGLHARGGIDLLPGFLSVPWLSSRLSGELTYYDAEGNVTQTSYRNEGGDPGDTLEDVPHSFESLRLGVALELAVHL